MNKKLLIKIIPIIITILLILLITSIYFFSKLSKANFTDKINTSKYGFITDYQNYDTHLSITGYINAKIENPKLVLKNKTNEIDTNSIFTIDNNILNFTTDKDKNNGINLENIQQGSYYLLIKSNDNKYYSLKNKTNNSNKEYSITTENNKIINIKILWNTSDLLPNMEIKID